MTVDIRLNQMINALDGRLRAITIDEVELSVRTLKALKDCGVRTLHDAQMAIINRQLHKQHGIGPKAVREVEEILFNVSASLPPIPTKAESSAAPVEVDGAIRIGGFVIEQPYGGEAGKVGIYLHQHGEGGDFDAAELEALIAAYYEENF